MTKILVTLGILAILATVIIYKRIGERIAQKWYMPKVQTIAIDSLINLKQEDLDEIESDMGWWWPILAPIEAISGCFLFRFCY